MARDPGEYNRRVTLLAPVRTPDGGGGYLEVPSPVATMWAKVEPLTGTEQTEAMQTGILRPHRFTVPYRDGLAAVSNVEYRGRAFDVKSVQDEGARHFELVLLADEVFP